MNTIGIVGAGTMGSGIAQVMGASGIRVVLNDVDERALEKGMASVAGGLERLAAKGTITEADRTSALALVTATTRLDDLHDCDLVIEAATEDAALKLELFGELDRIAKPQAILASNTSSISLTRIAAATKRPAQVIGMHFFNPVPTMKLLEVIRAAQTSDATHDAVAALARRIGKTPVAVRNSPGFVANRVLLAMLNEAVFCLHEGVAGAKNIDEVMKLGMGHPMGPLALADLIGLDVCVAILDVLYEGFGDPKYRACPLWREKVEAGEFGRKSGRGFFSY